MDKAYSINWGGCCYVCCCIAEVLEKHNIPFKLVIYNCPDVSFEELDASCTHYAIELNGTVINKSTESNYKVYDNITYESLMYHYIDNEWNDIYNTKNNKLVKQLIKLCFNEVL